MVNLSFWIAAVLLTAVLYLCVPTLSPWWILAALPAGYLAAFLLYWIFIITVWFFLPSKKDVKKPIGICKLMIYLTAGWFCSIARARVTVKQSEALPKEPCVIVANHLSFFDPMVMLSRFKDRNVVLVSKKENYKIPLAGRYLKGACFLAVDRSNPRQAVQMLQRAGDEMKKLGVDVGIFPEGTRSRTGELMRFKEGAFIIAKQADAPIAVYALKGTDQIKKRFPFRSTHVTMELVKIIDKETVASMDSKELAQYAHDLIKEAL